MPCSFTADIQTLATDTLEANWTSLHQTKTAEAVTNILTSTFSDFGKNRNPHIYCLRWLFNRAFLRGRYSLKMTLLLNISK